MNRSEKSFLICSWILFQLYQRQEREAAILARKQKTYALLDDDEDGDGDVSGTVGSNAAPVSSQTRREEGHGKRFRRRAGTDADEDEDEEAYCLYSF